MGKKPAPAPGRKAGGGGAKGTQAPTTQARGKVKAKASDKKKERGPKVLPDTDFPLHARTACTCLGRREPKQNSLPCDSQPFFFPM
jgi:hypothetical protein